MRSGAHSRPLVVDRCCLGGKKEQAAGLYGVYHLDLGPWALERASEWRGGVGGELVVVGWWN